MIRFYCNNELVVRDVKPYIRGGTLYHSGGSLSVSLDVAKGYYLALDKNFLDKYSEDELSIAECININIVKITLKEIALFTDYNYQPGKYLCGAGKVTITPGMVIGVYNVFIEADSLEKFNATLSAFRAGELVREGSEISVFQDLSLIKVLVEEDLSKSEKVSRDLEKKISKFEESFFYSLWKYFGG